MVRDFSPRAIDFCNRWFLCVAVLHVEEIKAQKMTDSIRILPVKFLPAKVYVLFFKLGA